MSNSPVASPSRTRRSCTISPILERRIVVCGPCAKKVAERIVSAVEAESSGPFLDPLISEFRLTGDTPQTTQFLVKIYAPKKIPLFWYPTVSCFVVSFDVHSANSFNSLLTSWIPILKDHAPNTPLFLAAWDSTNSDKPLNEAVALADRLKTKLYRFHPSTEALKPQCARCWSIICASLLLGPLPAYSIVPRENTNWNEYIDSNVTLIKMLARFLIAAESEEEKIIDISSCALPSLPKWYTKALTSIPWLQTLNLSQNLLTELPETLCESPALEILEISNNQLEFLPTGLKNISTLRKIKCKGNPLSCIPRGSIRNTRTILSYLGSLQDHTTSWKQIKLLIVGSENVGKTTLLRELIQQKVPTKIPASFKELSGTLRRKGSLTRLRDVSTEGIDVREWNTGDVLFSCWDFAGQTIFYPTHQFFLSGRSIYILTFNLMEPNHTKIEYWLQQIDTVSSFVSFVIIVGTHADDPKCTEEYIQEVLGTLKSKFQRKFSFIQSYFATGADDRSSFTSLTSFLINTLAKNHRFLKTQISGAWQALATAITQERGKGRQIMSTQDFRTLAYSHGVKENQFEMVREFLHDTGIIVSLPANSDDSILVIDPSWLSNVMSCIITLKHKWIPDGILLQSNWQHVWNSFPNSIHPQLFHVLETFEVVHKLRGDPIRSLVPSLLPESEPVEVQENWKILRNWTLPDSKLGYSGLYRYGRVWKFSFLPVGIFARVLVRLLHFVDTSVICMWRYGILLKFHDQEALLKYNEAEYTFSLEVRTPKSGLPILMRQTVDSVNSLLETLYSLRADQRHIYIPCVHCWQESKDTESPYLFPLENIVLALSRGSPFVFCHSLLNRKVRIDRIAPDIAFGGVPTIPMKAIQLGEQIGKGGFGVVYTGTVLTHPQFPIVAIKEIVGEYDEEIVEVFTAFQREAQIMSCFDHPNLVKLLGATSAGHPMYLVMEYIPGGTLFDLLHNKTISDEKLDWGFRIRICLDIANGMNYLHSTTPPFIHRDLRSPNILLLSTNKKDNILAKVADFGLTCTSAPNTGGALATWQWHAPEVICPKHKVYDEKIDVYSFGILVWEIVSREFPFSEYASDMRFCRVMEDDNGTTHFVTQEIQIREAIESSDLRPTIPSGIPFELSNLIQSCWKASAQERPTFDWIVSKLSDMLQIENDCAPQLIDLHTYCNPNRISHAYASLQLSGGLSALEEQQDLFRYSYSVSLPLHCNPLCLVVACGNIWCGCDTGDIIIYSTTDHQLIKAYKPHNTSIYSLLVVGDKVWSSSECHTLFIWDIDDYSNQECLSTNEQSIRHLFLDYTPRNGVQYVWSCSPRGAIQLWNTKTFDCIKSIQLDIGANRISHFAQMSRTRVWVAAGGNIVILSTDLIEIKRFQAHNKKINQLLPKSNGFVWSCSDDNTIATWGHDGTLDKRREVHMAGVNCLLSLGNYVCSGSSDCSVVLWDSHSVCPLQELEGYHRESIKCMVATGNCIWCGSFDRTVSVWTLT